MYYDVLKHFYGKHEATWLGGGRESFAHPDAHLDVLALRIFSEITNVLWFSR